MEYLLIAVVVIAVGYYVWTKKKPVIETKTEVLQEVPAYKVEAPAPQPTVEVFETKPTEPVITAVKPVTAKKPASRKAKPAAKPATEKTPAKKTPKLKISK